MWKLKESPMEVHPTKWTLYHNGNLKCSGTRKECLTFAAQNMTDEQALKDERWGVTRPRWEVAELAQEELVNV